MERIYRRPPDRETEKSPSDAMTVSELNQAAAALLKGGFGIVRVTGEVSEFKRSQLGHWYFTIKDEKASVSCAMFKGRQKYAEFLPEIGDKLVVTAEVSLYQTRGEFQLAVQRLEKAGSGALYEKFLKLKEKLEKEGLFDNARKKEIPLIPETVGIVTSPNAAALRDVITTLSRRAPHVRLIIYPAQVQGKGSAEQIAAALDAASRRKECDTVILCRGGGSIEDLWSFNEEIVARAIAACEIPIISGVGHETDFTIADFASDLRAPTPTGAAERAARPRADWMDELHQTALDLKDAMQSAVNNRYQNTDRMKFSLDRLNPANRVKTQRAELKNAASRLKACITKEMTRHKNGTISLIVRLRNKKPDTAPYLADLRKQAAALKTAGGNAARAARKALDLTAAKLELLNPDRTLERGFAVITGPSGRILRSPSEIPVGKPVRIEMAKGRASVTVKSVQPEL